MSAHTHREFVPGCFRCELGRDEEMAMTTDHSPSLDEIRERAWAAIVLAVPRTEPRWEPYFTVHGDPFVVPADNPHLSHQIAQVSTAPEDYGRALATYIAMMDPQTTLGLVARAENAEKERDALAGALGWALDLASDAGALDEDDRTAFDAAVGLLRAIDGDPMLPIGTQERISVFLAGLSDAARAFTDVARAARRSDPTP